MEVSTAEGHTKYKTLGKNSLMYFSVTVRQISLMSPDCRSSRSTITRTRLTQEKEKQNFDL